MKRIAVFLIVFCICVGMLSACGSRKKTESAEIVITYSEHHDKSHVNSEINILYPQIEGKEYAGINKIIKEYVEKQTEVIYGADYSDLALNISYRVPLCDGNIMSIVFEGVGNVYAAAYPNNIFCALNIDMKTETVIKLQDIYNIDSGFVSAYRSSPYCVYDESLSEYIGDYISRYSDEEIADMLSQADTGESGVYSYYTAEGVGISIPTLHAIGDHAEIEIPYALIENNKR